MKIFLTDQRDRLHAHLEVLKKKPVMTYTKESLREKISTSFIATDKLPEDVNLDVIFSYSIFPGHIMSYLNQWQAEHRDMRAGDTIVQQVYIPPVKVFSQKIVFGVRIREVIDEPMRKGFSYETIDGHAEKGISTFVLERRDEGLMFTIHTYSALGNLLSRLLGPVFSLPYQAYCTRQALIHVKQQLLAL